MIHFDPAHDPGIRAALVGDDSPPGAPSMGEIIRAAARLSGVSVAELLGPCRERRLAYPRQVAMTLCREMTGASLPQIGRRFGGRDHTTVLHAIRATEARMTPALEAAMEAIRREVQP